MNLRMTHDPDANVFSLHTGEEVRGASRHLVNLPDVVLDLGGDGSRHVVALEVIGASAYLPLGTHGYDPDTDTLTMGEMVDDPAYISENGDIVTYWRKSYWPGEETPDVDPVAVSIRRMSAHPANVRVL